MEGMRLQEYQLKAIDSIRRATERGQKQIIVDMPVGYGRGIIVIKTAEIISNLRSGRILILTSTISIKEQTENLLRAYVSVTEGSNSRILVETIQKFIKNQSKNMVEYESVIFYDIPITERIYSTFYDEKKTIVVFLNSRDSVAPDLPVELRAENVVFSYSLKSAVYDGIITPAMGNGILEYAIENYLEHLIEQFGYNRVKFNDNLQNQGWDLVTQKGDSKMWVECKLYKSQVVSPPLANSLLNKIIAKKIKHNIQKNDIVLFVVFNNIPSISKKEIYEKYGVIVWDIENLVFYSKNDSLLSKQLTQITYFPIEYIEGRPSDEAQAFGLCMLIDENNIVSEVEKEDSKSHELMQQLKDCKMGRDYSETYEELCESIVRLLFEADYFNKLTNQHKTNDKHFGMDLIGSLKVCQNNKESMHPLWDMLTHHFNSHFIIFEFKNYAEEIDQNLVYITEKYLFDIALRNVAIIISRKGFSESAKFAAEGCLKEHGKLILDVSDEDLVHMLERGGGEAADYLLGKLEDFLMGISK